MGQIGVTKMKTMQRLEVESLRTLMLGYVILGLFRCGINFLLFGDRSDDHSAKKFSRE
jgi:hypothetical protein